MALLGLAGGVLGGVERPTLLGRGLLSLAPSQWDKARYETFRLRDNRLAKALSALRNAPFCAVVSGCRPRAQGGQEYTGLHTILGRGYHLGGSSRTAYSWARPSLLERAGHVHPPIRSIPRARGNSKATASRTGRRLPLAGQDSIRLGLNLNDRLLRAARAGQTSLEWPERDGRRQGASIRQAPCQQAASAMDNPHSGPEHIRGPRAAKRTDFLPALSSRSQRPGTSARGDVGPRT